MNGKRDLATEKEKLNAELTKTMKNLRAAIKSCEAAHEIVWSAQEDANDGRIKNASERLRQLHARFGENACAEVDAAARGIRFSVIQTSVVKVLEEESNDGRE